THRRRAWLPLHQCPLLIAIRLVGSGTGVLRRQILVVGVKHLVTGAVEPVKPGRAGRAPDRGNLQLPLEMVADLHSPVSPSTSVASRHPAGEHVTGRVRVIPWSTCPSPSRSARATNSPLVSEVLRHWY